MKNLLFTMFLRGPKKLQGDPEDPEEMMNWTLAPYKSAKGRPANGRPANGRTANWHSQLANWQLQDSKEWQLTDWQDGKGWQSATESDLGTRTWCPVGTVADIKT